MKHPETLVPLASLEPGREAVIERLEAGRGLVSRLAALGLVPREAVRVLLNHGAGPVVVLVRGGRVAVGRGQALRIFVRPIGNGKVTP